MKSLSHMNRALVSATIVSVLAGCGGGDEATTAMPLVGVGVDAIPVQSLACDPGNDVVGTWKVIANNATTMPDSPQLKFFSYNQPSVNEDGLVVFRGRAKSATGDIQRGIYSADACPPRTSILTVADTVNTMVPAPNNTAAAFNEFPSIPRIDLGSSLIATRGQSAPVWTYTDSLGASTKVGTSGLFVKLASGLATGVGLLGNVTDFAYMQVPDASTAGLTFDQFPGSPSVSDGRYLAFKGNFNDGISKTGVFYRDLNIANAPVVAVADSNTVIPASATNLNNPGNTMFGSTAPPSAAKGKMVFVGLDNEQAPTMGGIYMAAIAHKPVLDVLVQIGDAVPKNTDSTLAANFTQIGEGLAFDGRFVAFWAAWATSPSNTAGEPGLHMHRVKLACPADGNSDLKAACLAGSDKDDKGISTGFTAVDVPDNQGIFVVDTTTKVTLMVARSDFANTAGAFNGFMYWTYSGSTQGGDAEPPHWRSSAFAAIDGNRGVIFKGSPNSTTGTGISGIYGVTYSGNSVGSIFKVVATGDPMNSLDSSAPTVSPITSVSIEREALRKGWLVLTASSADWAGAYVSYFPNTFRLGAVLPDQPGIYSLILGK
jgi:hypothetical protein